ncbi:MAG: T9SS type A sorting domain-containing protein, partial [Bacteroidales bacterium]|nr:T9SS type A sorting domain-containing protein [Bacteroidales bacterium]
TYVWLDGSVDQQFVVEYENQTPDSTYAVTVTDANGCKASDEVKISFDLWDVGISSIQSPRSACTLSDQEQLRLFVKNFGTKPIVDERISVNARVDGGLQTKVLQRIIQLLNPGDSIEFLFASTFDLSGKGDHRVMAYSVYGQDEDPLNDTVDVIITHFGIPEPELGGENDTLGTSLPLTLDAGAGYISYLWNGVDGGQTYEANGYGWYTVEVISPEGCTGKDSVNLTPHTGIEDIILPGELKVYPVPASRFLNIEYRYNEAESLFLDIFDSLGRKILIKQFSNATEITETVDVTGMAKGVYYLRLRSDERQLIRQITIH